MTRPDDVVEVTISGTSPARRRASRFVLADDLDAFAVAKAAEEATAVRPVGPFDLPAAARPRAAGPPDERRKELWRTLGRPGAIVADGEILGLWRPRSSGRRLSITIAPWPRLRADERTMIDEQAERLAAHRGATLAGVGPG